MKLAIMVVSYSIVIVIVALVGVGGKGNPPGSVQLRKEKHSSGMAVMVTVSKLS
jgi:hypothetical protein